LLLFDGCSAGGVAGSGQQGSSLVSNLPVSPGEAVRAYAVNAASLIQAYQIAVPPTLATLQPDQPVMVELLVDPAGDIRSLSVYRSCGIPQFDQLAMQEIVHVSLPQFTPEMPQKPLYFLAPVVFRRL
jgi:TonB family protein